jgi:DNA-directed RNA polymerase specialized sigma24 family protein
LLRYSRAHFPRLAEDITAEVWLRVTRALDRFVGGEPEFRAWIFAIASNEIMIRLGGRLAGPRSCWLTPRRSTATGTTPET